MHANTDTKLPATLAGTWTGEYELRLRPDIEPELSQTSAIATLDPDGSALVLRYDWTRDGVVKHGTMLLVVGDDGAQLAFTDTFHSGGAIMHCRGDGRPDWSTRASYGPADEPWGWRTELHQPSDDELVVTAWNVMPDGTELLATLATYRRVA